MTNSIVCHLGAPRYAKPETLQEYGKLREQMIQRPWVCLSEEEFVTAITQKGCPFYQGLMQGRDLMELQYERLVWRKMRLLSGNLADKHAANPTRMWQGTTRGAFCYNAEGTRLNLRELAK